MTSVTYGFMTVAASTARRPAGGPALLTSLIVTVLLLGPGLAPGYLWYRDLVIVPQAPLNAGLLGLWTMTPRTVPSDALVAVASHLVPGWVVEKGILVLVLVLLGWGTGRLVGPSRLTQVAVAVAVLWNPFVTERLAMGQWVVLVGAAGLPWMLAQLARALSGDRRASPGLTLAVVAGALGGALAWLGLAVAAVGAAGGWWVVRGRRCGRSERGVFVRLGVVFGATALPWSVPGLLGGHQAGEAGLTVFRPSADLPLGLMASVLTGGGVWNAEAVPTGRDSVVGAIVAVVLLALAALGWVVRGRRPDVAGAPGGRVTDLPIVLAGAGIASLLAALLPSVGPVAEGLAHLPGGGLFRDGQRLLGAWVVLLAVGVGYAAATARRFFPHAPIGAAIVVLPLLSVPGAAWGLGGSLTSQSIPASFQAAADVIESGPPGSVAVQPFQAYRRYAWNGERTSYTPWPRLLDRPVAAYAALVVSTPEGLVEIPGEDRYADRVGASLTGPSAASDLRGLGVRFVLSDDPTVEPPPGLVPVPLPLVNEMGGATAQPIAVWQVPGPVHDGAIAAYQPPAIAILLGDLLAVVIVVLVLRFQVTFRYDPGQLMDPAKES
ncbi:MAG: hypothetical protein ACK5MP_04075 [Nostocoides sp.]